MATPTDAAQTDETTQLPDSPVDSYPPDEVPPSQLAPAAEAVLELVAIASSEDVDRNGCQDY